MRDIDIAINDLFVSNSIRRMIKDSVVGTYEINGCNMLVLSLDKKESIEDQFNQEEHWESLQYSLARLASCINEDNHFSDKPHKSILSWVFYFDNADDSTVTFEFSTVEPVDDTFNIKVIRALCKEHFEKYKIVQKAEFLASENFISCFYGYRKPPEKLTRRTITVKVPKEQVTYHALIGKFKKYTNTD